MGHDSQSYSKVALASSALPRWRKVNKWAGTLCEVLRAIQTVEFDALVVDFWAVQGLSARGEITSQPHCRPVNMS